MEAPFIYGKIATEENFTDREEGTATLVSHFTSLVNTIIISPRRWGKSSLCSTEVLYRYRISSVTSAARSKMTLLKNDVLDNSGNVPAFQDPVYAHWLKDVYFRK